MPNSTVLIDYYYDFIFAPYAYGYDQSTVHSCICIQNQLKNRIKENSIDWMAINKPQFNQILFLCSIQIIIFFFFLFSISPKYFAYLWLHSVLSNYHYEHTIVMCTTAWSICRFYFCLLFHCLFSKWYPYSIQWCFAFFNFTHMWSDEMRIFFSVFIFVLWFIQFYFSLALCLWR